MNADVVRAAAEALSEHYVGDGAGYFHGAARAAVAAAEPIIRADERAATRAAIAAEIRAEAKAGSGGCRCVPCSATRDGYRAAARIAEGAS